MPKKRDSTSLTDVEGGRKMTRKESKTGNVDHYDSSDEEDLRNTIGNIPVQWYEGHSHVGYDWGGKKIAKRGGAERNSTGAIDQFLEKVEDPDYWRRVFDQQSGGDVVLTDEQVEKLRAIAHGRYPKLGYNPYQPFLDIFSSQKEIHPISNEPEHKRSFVPSADERKMVSKMVHAMKMGWMKIPRDGEEEGSDDEEDEDEQIVEASYDLWETEGEPDTMSRSQQARMRIHLPAPKVALPTHSESYNPPAEYLFDEEEKAKWEKTDKESRRPNFLPHKYDSLRRVPFYEEFYDERLERCLDLALAPRKRKMRLNVDPQVLLPNLPNPRDLQPFPTTLAFYLRGHNGQVRSLSVEPRRGELLVSGGEDSTVRVWYLPNGFCMKSYKFPAPITCLECCPFAERTLLLVGCEDKLVTVMNVECGDKMSVSSTYNHLASLEFTQPGDGAVVHWSKALRGGDNERVNVELRMPDSDSLPLGVFQAFVIPIQKVRSVTWHRKGDYFATVGFEASTTAVLIHQLSKGETQRPFNKNKGRVACVQFHPSKPWFFVATQQHIRLYDLAKCELKRKLYTGSRWVSCMQLHSQGNNLFVAGLDRVFSWLDLELSAKPWKSLKHHTSAIRSICCHRRYPLLATASDDASVIVYHAKVSDDLMQDNQLVPVKRLSAHSKTDGKGRVVAALATTQKPNDDAEAVEVDTSSSKKTQGLAILSVTFHPTQPWLLTAGADGKIGLFSY